MLARFFDWLRGVPPDAAMRHAEADRRARAMAIFFLQANAIVDRARARRLDVPRVRRVRGGVIVRIPEPARTRDPLSFFSEGAGNG
jgi:hypothetical protein